ncbi:MAG: arginine--tRNA ligase [Patescibacteria group bacterium]|jgi:arginyl-tRNA synthetase
MTTLETIKKEILAQLSGLLPPDLAVSATDLVRPPKPEMGDLAFGCFGASKLLKKNPAAVAQELASGYKTGGFIAAVRALGPYLNFDLDRSAYSAAVIGEVLSARDGYGTRAATGERVMIEYAQPNTHKEFHVGHLRNICLGIAVVNLGRAAGQEVIPVSYMGDIGSHVAKCLWCLKKFHADEMEKYRQSPELNRGKFLGQIYAEATRRVDEDEKLKEEIADVQRRLEAREPEWDALWRETREWSLVEFKEIFAELGVEIERAYYESEVEEPGKKLVRELLAKGLAEIGEREAIIVNLEKYSLGIFLALKGDGSSLYATKELALAQLKFSEYQNVSRSIHVVDSRQSLYFKQFFKTLELMGFDKLKTTHLAYEFVTLKEGAMSSRKGNIIAYEDFRDELASRVAGETRQKQPDWSESRIKETAWLVAEGAMKFGMLKQDPDKPIVFDIEAALAFDGFTGPYIQYAHARLSSIIAKASPYAKAAGDKGGVPAATKFGAAEENENALVARIAEYPEIVAGAAAAFKPSILAQYLFDLAQAANDYYRDVPVIAAASAAEREHRLLVIEAACLTIENGLRILGIKAPREM